MFDCNDIDRLMIDWLYKELDEPQAQQVANHVQGCTRCADEQAAMMRTRELFRDMPDQEPSRGTAMLIREAALSSKKKTASNAEPRGLGAWIVELFQPLLHPAVGALAMLVLVGGVGGVLYLHHGDDQIARPSTQLESVVAKGKSEAATSLKKMERTDKSRDGMTAAVEKAGEIVAAESLLPNSEGRGRSADILDQERTRTLRSRSNPTGEVKRSSKPPSQAQATSAKMKRAAKMSDSGRRKGTKTLGFEERTKERPEEPSAGGVFPDRGVDLKRPIGFGDDTFDGGTSRWVFNKEDELIAAYKRNDCRKVARLASDIREREPSHYRERTSTLTAVKRCRQYVKLERDRRTQWGKAKKSSVPVKKD